MHGPNASAPPKHWYKVGAQFYARDFLKPIWSSPPLCWSSQKIIFVREFCKSISCTEHIIIENKFPPDYLVQCIANHVNSTQYRISLSPSPIVFKGLRFLS